MTTAVGGADGGVMDGLHVDALLVRVTVEGPSQAARAGSGSAGVGGCLKRARR